MSNPSESSSSLSITTTVAVAQNSYLNQYDDHDDRHHRYKVTHKNMSSTNNLIFTSTIMMILMFGFIIANIKTVSLAHSPPIPSRMNWNPVVSQLMRQRLLSNKQQSTPFINEYYYRLQTNNHAKDVNDRLAALRSRLESLLTTSNSYSKHYSNPLKYYHYKHHPQHKNQIPTCEELCYLWTIKQLVDDFEEPETNKLTNSVDNDDQTYLDNDETLKQMILNIPKEKQVYITKIVPEKEEISLDIIENKKPTNDNNKPLASGVEAETVSPYGIVHNSPSSARRGSISASSAETIGFFGEFLDDFFPLPNRTNIMKSIGGNIVEQRQRYLNGYNLRNGKQGMKISESKPISYGGRQRSHDQMMMMVNNNPNESMSPSSISLSSSPQLSSLPSSLSSSASKMLMPGFWHEKPVKPSVSLVN